MKGDIIIVEEHHRRAAHHVVDHLRSDLARIDRTFTISVAGESGSGKSETARALAEEFESFGFRVYVLQQDDYFVLPPKSNDTRRRSDISWVGPGEVKLDLLDQHLADARRRAREVEKPLVIYGEDRIESEVVDMSALDVVVAEGTYTTMLANVDCRIFIDRNRLETLASRTKRGREPIEPFIEEVLEIEHRIISTHKAMADIVVSRDFDVSFQDPAL